MSELCRNYVGIIANMMYLSKDVERWGSGLKRIYEECSLNNVKVTFEKERGGFSIIFYRPEKVGEKVGEKLTGNQEKIIKLVLDNPYISARELSFLVGISSRKIEENIAKLKQKGLLKRIGPDKGGYWEVQSR